MLPNHYEFQCTLIDKVLVALGDVPTYGLYAWHCQATTAIIVTTMDYSSNRKYKMDQTEKEDKGQDDMEIVEVPLTDIVDAIPVENSSTANALLFK